LGADGQRMLRSISKFRLESFQYRAFLSLKLLQSITVRIQVFFLLNSLEESEKKISLQFHSIISACLAQSPEVSIKL
jgi:hypothetical protein